MKRLLAIFAHPDDEGAIAGTLARYAHEGVVVSLVCATKGEAGEISDPSLATTENLGSVREDELRCACAVLGISELHLLDYCDSGMEGTDENELPTAFINADPDEVRGKLVRIIRATKPQVVLTFEPFGWYGHPDHIAAGRYATEAFELAGNPDAYPEAGDAWLPSHLFHAVLSLSQFKAVVDYAREHGIDLNFPDEFPLEREEKLAAQITHRLDTQPYQEKKSAATACHRTQFGDDHLFRRVPQDIIWDSMRYEHFIQVEPPLTPAPTPFDDLYAGLPAEPK
ncbi:MAG: PIG-L family deacetylase [Chloroflexota bacterium]|nr:MAG: PIG-L family deacetylase [Chloroflexota bacterium]